MRKVFSIEKSVVIMGTSHIHDDVKGDQPSRTMNHRVSTVIVLCAILVVLGSILLTSTVKKTPAHLTSNIAGNTRTALSRKTHIVITKPSQTPTKIVKHAPVLDYPLVN